MGSVIDFTPLTGRVFSLEAQTSKLKRDSKFQAPIQLKHWMDKLESDFIFLKSRLQKRLTDDFGFMTIGGSQTQSIVAVVEDLGNAHTNFVALRPPLIEHGLNSGEFIKLGIRTTARTR